MRSPDHPSLAFVQARYYASGRGGRRPLWIVVHDMEAGESAIRAENTAEYFRTMPDGRSVSSHYTADSDSVIQCVKLADTAYTVGNTPGNRQGINWEFAGFARQTRAQWLDDFGLAMFRQAAPYIRADAARFKIPLRRCSVADLVAFRPGVTSHNDLRLAFGGTSHTDPGPNFPWDVFMQIITTTTTSGEDDDMPSAQEVALAVWSATYGREERRASTGVMLQEIRTYSRAAAERVLDQADLAAIANAAKAGVLASADELVAAIVAKLPAGTLTRDDVEAAVREAFQGGLAPDAAE